MERLRRHSPLGGAIRADDHVGSLSEQIPSAPIAPEIVGDETEVLDDLKIPVKRDPGTGLGEFLKPQIAAQVQIGLPGRLILYCAVRFSPFPELVGCKNLSE